MATGWAVIGTGRILKWMVPAIKAAKDTRLVAVLSRDKKRAIAFAAEYGIERAYESLDELLADPDVDVVYVASPNGLHARHTISAAAAGKSVLCEKPMAPTLEECRSMIDACQKHGVKLGIGFMYRHYPAHQKARELVASGELGDLVFANAQVEIPPRWVPGWYYEPGMAGGGIIYLAGVHRIDLLRFILGHEVVEVSAFIGEQTPARPFEEIAVAMFRFDNGAYGTVHFSMNIPHGTNHLEVHGSRASLFGDTTSTWWGETNPELLLKSDLVTTTYSFQKTDAYKDQVEDFNRCLKDNRESLATGLDGLRAVEVSLAMFESGRQGRPVRIGT